MEESGTLILASASRQRSRILEECGLRFRAVESGAEEVSGRGMAVSEMVVRNARLKADLVAGSLGAGTVLGADTEVSFGGRLVRCGAGRRERRELLERFSGKPMEVLTGLCLVDAGTGSRSSGWDSTVVRTRPLSGEEIRVFLEHTPRFEGAGGFSIEGAGSLVFDDISGSYYNVLGLPMMLLSRLMEEMGLNIFSFMESGAA